MNLEEYEKAKAEMMGKGKIRRKIKKIGMKLLAVVAWKINRWADANRNNKSYNQSYFDIHKKEIAIIESFLEDDYSKETYLKCIQYRSTHKVCYQPDYNKKNEYFPRDIIQLGNEEVFVDCGAFTGDTIQKFINFVKGNYRNIIAFEPSKINSKKIMSDNRKITIIQKGAWDKEERLYFVEDEEQSMIIDECNGGESPDSIQCCRLDSCIECKDATFIKMDIEGAEMKALKGAEKIISQNHPKLAICIYHSAEDMVQIPIYLKEKYPFYKFYVRHHSHRCSETVLYAIPN